MKILITTDLYSVKTNGVVTSVTNLVNELRLKGHDVRILTLSNTTTSFVKDDVYYIGSFPLNIVYPGIRGCPLHRNNITDMLIQWHPDIIHSQCEFFTFRYAKIIAKRCSVPIVHTYHTLYESFAQYIRLPSSVSRTLVRLLSKYRLKSVKTVIAPSQKVYSILKEYGVRQEIHIVPSGIALEQHFAPCSVEKKKELREKNGINENAFVLISLGRLGKEKNIDELLLCLSVIAEDCPNVVLIIVGDGPERKELESWVAYLSLAEHVIFIGAVSPEEVHTYYQMADVFVSASTSETQGLVYVEAAANGLPLICHKDSCLCEILCENENGFSYESIYEFKKAFSQCLNDDDFRKTAAIASRANALKFSKQEFADKLEGIYLSLLPQELRSATEENRTL